MLVQPARRAPPRVVAQAGLVQAAKDWRMGLREFAVLWLVERFPACCQREQLDGPAPQPVLPLLSLSVLPAQTASTATAQ